MFETTPHTPASIYICTLRTKAWLLPDKADLKDLPKEVKFDKRMKAFKVVFVSLNMEPKFKVTEWPDWKQACAAALSYLEQLEKLVECLSVKTIVQLRTECTELGKTGSVARMSKSDTIDYILEASTIDPPKPLATEPPIAPARTYAPRTTQAIQQQQRQQQQQQQLSSSSSNNSSSSNRCRSSSISKCR